MINRYLTLDFQGHAVRAAVREGIPWFAAADLAGLLGYADPAAAVFELVRPDDSALVTTYRPGLGVTPVQEWIVNGFGLADLIDHSGHPIAQDMRRWLVSEAAPTLEDDTPRTVPIPDLELARMLATGPRAVLGLLCTVIDTAQDLLARTQALEAQLHRPAPTPNPARPASPPLPDLWPAAQPNPHGHPRGLKDWA